MADKTVWVVGKYSKHDSSLVVAPHDAATAAQLEAYLQQAQAQTPKPTTPGQDGAK